jgi:tripartite ATP-independent transporter DctP family solute receptor
MVCVLALLVFGMTVPAMVQAATVLKLGHAVATSSHFHSGALKFKEEVEKRTNGEVVVQVFPSGQLGSLREMLEGVQMGNLDFVVAVSSFVATFCPDVYIFDMPALFDNNEHAYRAMDGKLGDHLNAKLETVGILSLGWFQHGFRNISSNKDIKTVDDLKGVRLRIMPSNIFRDIFLALGADPVPMNWEELFTALQQGTVDGQENPYPEIFDARFYEVQKYLIETEHVFSPAILAMSPATIKKLTPAQLTAIKEAGKIAVAEERIISNTRVESVKKSLVEEHGMQFRALDKKAMREKVKSVYDKYPEYSKLIEMVNSYR